MLHMPMLHTFCGDDLWQLSVASVTGKSHAATGLPNQDGFQVRSVDGGRVLAIAVSDGAGTAKLSAEGSRVTARAMAEALAALGSELREGKLEDGEVRRLINEGIERVRAELLSTGHPLNLYHCTFVGAVLTETQSYVCQIGDSAALVTRFAELGDEPGAALDFFPDGHALLLVGERGQYANETHFITEAGWASQVQLILLEGHHDAVFLMTDGAMDVVVTKGKIFRGFLSNLVAKLLDMPSEAGRNELLASWLADPRTHRITGDDKTMVVALRASATALAGRRFIADEPEPGAPPPRPILVEARPTDEPLPPPRARDAVALNGPPGGKAVVGGHSMILIAGWLVAAWAFGLIVGLLLARALWMPEAGGSVSGKPPVADPHARPEKAPGIAGPPYTKAPSAKPPATAPRAEQTRPAAPESAASA